MHLSLAAEVDRLLVGFMAVTFFYGEFGKPEPVAVLDVIGVDPEYRAQGIARRLLGQLETHLKTLRVKSIRTELDWTQLELLGFLARADFQPAARISLEKRLLP